MRRSRWPRSGVATCSRNRARCTAAVEPTAPQARRTSSTFDPEEVRNSDFGMHKQTDLVEFEIVHRILFVDTAGHGPVKVAPACLPYLQSCSVVNVHGSVVFLICNFAYCSCDMIFSYVHMFEYMSCDTTPFLHKVYGHHIGE